jgi:hypothetical protein
MSSETGVSILDAALACFGERVSAIFLQPGKKNENYIASLHNEVVSIAQFTYSPIMSLNLVLDSACCRVDYWYSVIWR